MKKGFIIGCLISLIGLVSIIYGCTVLSTKIIPSFKLNEEVIAPVGGIMISVESWTGAVDPKYGIPQNYYNKFRFELLYNGQAGDIIEITYREFALNYARSPFFQTAKYDLSKSDIIVFRRTIMKVLEATNAHIKFIVTSSPVYDERGNLIQVIE